MVIKVQSVEEKQPSNVVLKKFASAGLSCAIVSSILNPFDVIKIRLQLNDEKAKLYTLQGGHFRQVVKTIIQNEGGVISLWTRGLTASIMREITYSSLRIGLYEAIRNYNHKDDKRKPSLGKKILSGALGGAVASSLTNPCDVVKIRLQNERGKTTGQRYSNTFSAFSTILKEEGFFRGWYQGVSATVLRAAILTASQLSTYDHSKVILTANFPQYFQQHHPQTHVVSALISGLVTSLITQPFDCIKTRYMNDPNQMYSNVYDCVLKTIKNEGILAFYKGFSGYFLRLGSHFIMSLPLLEFIRMHLFQLQPI
ncbi:unnamed protein product [Didymodactylos carnosus]|uniref:Uncharacterized protein n=1 Tax=Didymodactylos carnosus TaxID=1234261 RepID=A0A815XEE8_9BILA|nr:unnamed protein product [Didymodactylos carnosus]CAF1556395.1 unnamed protein product [Didymodactylos carnosus]CAF4012942.1 unnamed protein product [Didymodactylos carnosus]CAF4417519.1 unnamed protein product [Didymodactylos carnosus]